MVNHADLNFSFIGRVSLSITCSTGINRKLVKSWEWECGLETSWHQTRLMFYSVVRISDSNSSGDSGSLCKKMELLLLHCRPWTTRRNYRVALLQLICRGMSPKCPTSLVSRPHFSRLPEKQVRSTAIFVRVLQNVGALFFSNLMLDVIEHCIPHCAQIIY